jgi:hypothetical protein
MSCYLNKLYYGLDPIWTSTYWIYNAIFKFSNSTKIDTYENPPLLRSTSWLEPTIYGSLNGFC